MALIEAKTMEGKTVLVTGASSGLGQACASLAIERGARLIAVGRRTEVLRELYPEPHHVFGCDVSDEASVGTLVQSLKQLQTPVDGMVLAAGIQEVRPLMMESRASLENTWKANVYGTIGLLARALKSRLIGRGGSVVIFSSAATHAGGAGIVSYAASKGAVEASVHSLALELAPQGIRVNAIAAGVVRTPMADKYLSRMTEEQIRHIEAAHPLGLGTPKDIAEPVLFLLSEGARWITGSVLMVDGGLTSH
jgi:NAD(P)-dependent dehydrogenase (short-subunit alcohol dehydrogenase family)